MAASPWFLLLHLQKSAIRPFNVLEKREEIPLFNCYDSESLDPPESVITRSAFKDIHNLLKHEEKDRGRADSRKNQSTSCRYYQCMNPVPVDP
jgi:hypothetical protein